MMAGRPAERERRALAGLHQPGAGERDVDGRGDGAPGAGHDRRARIDGVVAELAVDRFGHGRVLAEAAGVPVQRQRVVGAVGLDPFVPGRAQELDEALVVDAFDGLEAEFLRRLDRAQLLRLHAVDDDLRPPRHLERRHELAVDQLELAVLVAMLVGVDGLHGASSVMTKKGRPQGLPKSAIQSSRHLTSSGPSRSCCTCPSLPSCRAARTPARGRRGS